MRLFPNFSARHLRPLLVWLVAGLAGAHAARELPPAPAGMILDQAQVLLPETAATLSLRLRAAAEERGIWVYVVTFPTLGVPPSKQKQRIMHLAILYRTGWLRDRVGVVLLVDDESGVTMAASSEAADRQYPPLQRDMLLKEPLRDIQKEPLRRDRIEKMALTVIEVISRLQDEQKEKARRDRMVNLAIVAIAIAGIGVIVLVRLAKAKRQRAKDGQS